MLYDNQKKFFKKILFVSPLFISLPLISASCIKKPKKPDFEKQNPISFAKKEALESFDKNLNKFDKQIEEYLIKEFDLNSLSLNKLLIGESLDIGILPNNEKATHKLDALLWNKEKSTGLIGVFKNFYFYFLNELDGLTNQLKFSKNLETKLFYLSDSISNILFLELTKLVGQIAKDVQNNGPLNGDINDYLLKKESGLNSIFNSYLLMSNDYLFSIVKELILNVETDDLNFNKEIAKLEPKPLPLKSDLKKLLEKLSDEIRSLKTPLLSIASNYFSSVIKTINGFVEALINEELNNVYKQKFTEIWTNKKEKINEFTKKITSKLALSYLLGRDYLLETTKSKFLVNNIQNNNLKKVTDFLANIKETLKYNEIPEDIIQKLTNIYSEQDKNILNENGYQKLYETELSKAINDFKKFHEPVWSDYFSNLINRNFDFILSLVYQNQTNNITEFVKAKKINNKITYEDFMKQNSNILSLNSFNEEDLKPNIDHLYLPLSQETIDKTLMAISNINNISEIVKPLRNFYINYFAIWKEAFKDPTLILIVKLKWEAEKNKVIKNLNFANETDRQKFKVKFDVLSKYTDDLLLNIFKAIDAFKNNVEKEIIKRIEKI